MPSITDMIFGAKCEIDNLEQSLDFDSGRIVGHANGEVEVELSDGSWTTIYLDPIKALIAALERLPAPPPA